MKHRFKNGKWMPENGTFVRVPNEEIPEVIQLLNENGQITEEDDTILVSENCVYFEEGEWGSFISDLIEGKEIPFPDFKALVTGKLPESWCIKCTKENVNHEYWPSFVEWFNRRSKHYFAGSDNGLYVGGMERDFEFFRSPFGEVLQIETWAALNDEEEYQSFLKEDEEIQNQIIQALEDHDALLIKEYFQPFTDDQLINELKSRGYTISKTY